MKLNRSILIGIVVFITSCSAIKKTSKNCGLFFADVRMYSKSKGIFVTPAYHSPDIKRWYRDSIVVMEGDSVSIKENFDGKESSEIFHNRYIYIDLRKRTFYRYRTFSDTAKIERKYSFYDSGRIDDKWNFFDTTSEFTSQNYFQAPDTTIGGIAFSRYRINSTRKSDFGGFYQNIETLYLRCDIKDFQLSFNKPLSFKTGCFVSRIEELQPELNTCIYYDMKMVRKTLTKEEHKIFDAWEKNARENPVRIN
jgi:hypothetical protein